MFRMERHIFIILLNDLVSNKGLKGSRNISPTKIRTGPFLKAKNWLWKRVRIFL